MNKIFHLDENNTTMSIEIRAGLTTFFALAYIIFVNPVFLSEAGMSADGAMIATCLAAAVGSLLCAFLSNCPLVMAPGMGMNAFFTYTLCYGSGVSWQQALALTFLSGVLFLVVVLVLKDSIMQLIPENLRHAITVGIGLFLALIGLLDSGIITMTEGYPAIGSLGEPSVIIAVIGLAITILLTVMNVRGSLIFGIIITAIISLIFGQSSIPEQAVLMPTALSDVFLKLDFSGLIGSAASIPFASLIALVVSMAIVDLFDTLGFLVGTGSKADLLNEKGEFPRARKVLLADAGSTIIGSLCGTSTVTVYAESAAGIAAGGKTGLTAVTTAICFLLSMFFAPLTEIVNSAVTAPALIVVGMYLMMDIHKLKVDCMSNALPALLTVIAIPLTYSITAGIAVGFLSHVICSVAAKKWSQLNISTLVLAAIFLVYFLL